ncbi:3-hydroxyacyl-CoA dehydrogenase family protein, partial [Sinomonas notoginsengisoli]|uniref:3-hydroxyacyl-CoA dehydrogenase family protein n=1 Tax=Sinomonas notoginsengisoli TaxID=1457311 RepID=UPI001F18A6FE
MGTINLAEGLPGHVGVLGGGRMGAGIAHAFLMGGAKVVVVERDEQAAQGAKERVESSVAKSIERGAVDGNLDEIVEGFSTSVDYADFGGCDLVVEAVPEDPQLKAEALTAVEAQLGKGAFLATNTSSLSVTKLAGHLGRPERFLGLHFFNPVPASTLIEVVIAERTSPEAEAAARGWVA